MPLQKGDAISIIVNKPKRKGSADSQTEKVRTDTKGSADSDEAAAGDPQETAEGASTAEQEEGRPADGPAGRRPSDGPTERRPSDGPVIKESRRRHPKPPGSLPAPGPRPSKSSYSAVPMAGLPLAGAICGLCLGGPVVSREH
jgi:hypothetical protein